MFDLKLVLKNAMTNEDWADVPAPLAAYYQQRLSKLPKKFVVRSTGLDSDERPRTEGTTTTQAITVYVNYQQRGRDQVKTFRWPAQWTWTEENGTMKLADVSDR